MGNEGMQEVIDWSLEGDDPADPIHWRIVSEYYDKGDAFRIFAALNSQAAASPALAKAVGEAIEVLEGLSVDPVAREELEHYWPRLAMIHQALASALAQAKGGG